MTPDDWERIKHVFSGALSVPADVREVYVLEACGGRADLRDAVTNLLAAHNEASNTFLEPAGILFDAPWLFRGGDRVAGRFTVIRTIARGAMGEVYEAHDDRLRLRVALKALRPQLVGDPQTAERFRREVLVTRDIAHDGLCRIFDLIEHPIGPGTGLPDGTLVPCLTMQLLEGQSLEDYLKARRPLRPAEAFPLLMQIAEALDMLHDHGIVHRDLKPSNVMLVLRGHERRAVLTDFGLAKPLDESLFETQSSVQGGAPFFMAPELFKGERPSLASDVYAFGLLIDELVTKRRAFSADSLHGLMLQKLQEGPARPSERSDGLPRSWDHAILRCLATDPKERFQRATDVCLALDPTRSTTRDWRPDWLRAVGRSRGWAIARARGLKYAAIAGAGAVGVAAALAVTSPDPPGVQSVIVLPFDNLTGDKAIDYLAVGTAGELGRRLSRVPGFLVHAARDASAPFDPALKAAYSLRGHVQQPGDTLRITVMLTDETRGALIWSNNYEGSRERALQLEDTLADEAAAALGRATVRVREGTMAALFSLVPFLRSAAPQVPGGGTTNPEAYDAYMRGRYLAELQTLPDTLSAIKLLKHATELDPGFAAPYALLSNTQQALMNLHYRPHDELLRQAEAYAEQAVALDANLPDGQLSLASVRQMQSRWDEAEAGFKKALALHDKYSHAYRWYAGMLLQFGRHDEALRLAARAIELDPYDVAAQQFLGLALFYSDRPEEAARQLERVVVRRDVLHPHLILGQVYALLAGRPGPQQATYLQKALEQAAVLRQKELADVEEGKPPRTEFADFVAALAWSFHGDPALARPFVRRLEAERAAGRTSPSILARIYAVQGRTGEALDALEASAAQHDRELMYLSVSPLYVHIRDEPRFLALVDQMHLPR